MTIKVKQCTCKSDFQDKEYGKDMRLCNVRDNKDYSRCTVCGKEHLDRK